MTSRHKDYGGLEFCPEEVTATVLEMEQLTMSEVNLHISDSVGVLYVDIFAIQELRGRYKSLGHLPLTCELVLCELELKPPLVSRDTLDHFSTEIHRRRQQRVKKRKDERRREKRAEARNSYPGIKNSVF